MEFEFDASRKSIPQGDCYLVPIKAVPVEAEPINPEGGRFVIAHSETGHDHIVIERPTVRMFRGMDIFRDFLLVEESPAELVHLREHHTHAPQKIEPGAWLIQRQAAYTPEGWQRAAD